jgi:hypothetical protein
MVHALQDPRELKLVGVVTFLSIEAGPFPGWAKRPEP